MYKPLTIHEYLKVREIEKSHRRMGVTFVVLGLIGIGLFIACM